MNILITGGLGYIGSSLVENLAATHNITVVDNFYTQRYCTLFNRKRKFKFIEKDFQHLYCDFLKQFEYVIHLAAIVDAANSNTVEQKILVSQVNDSRTKKFLKECQLAQVRVIFPSSTSVYGVSTEVVYEDDDSNLNPQSPYAEAKLAIEKALNKHCGNYTILRLGTVCGVSPGIRFQTCINKFCYQATFEQPISLWKQNVDFLRPYLSLTDLNKTIKFAINNWDMFCFQTYNVVTQNLSPNNILDKIRGITSHTLNINYVDCPLLNQFSYTVDTSKIQKKTLLKFRPLNIDNDIDNTLNLLEG